MHFIVFSKYKKHDNLKIFLTMCHTQHSVYSFVLDFDILYSAISIIFNIN
jgi:hypothetical protein